MKNPLTASERRGIIALAFVSLLITGIGAFMAVEGKIDQETIEETEVLVAPQSTDSLRKRAEKVTDLKKSNGNKNGKRKNSRKGTNGSKKSKKQKKEFKKRSPLDEPV